MNLEGLSFGDRVAENESDRLSSYFVKTEQWTSLFSGESDVIFGAKGSGKSALYTLLLNKSEELSEKGIILISAEKPTGKTVFSDITTEPPTTENEFVTLWKVYICQLIITWLMDNNLCDGKAENVALKLIDAGLIEDNNTLRKLVSRAKKFAKKLISIDSLEGGVTTEGSVTGKITFREPTTELHKKGYRSVDELIEKINLHLDDIKISTWILCDRLDVAFDETIELEKNALRALFKVYRDIEEYNRIRLKIFLRDDIWRRITHEGFREASHITRTATITWTDRNLVNLLVSRALGNKKISVEYKVKPSDILSDYDKQVEFYYVLFPRQIDIGEKQSETFQWIKSRVKDGLGNVAPRELIHFYNEAIAQEKREQEIGNNSIESPNFLSRQSIKNATYEVSKVRTEQTVFAEYSELRDFVMALENHKAEHTALTLSQIWGIDQDQAEEIALNLTEIGFFELKSARHDGIYKVPFLYRFYLGISQGKAN